MILPFGIALALSVLLVPAVRRFSFRVGRVAAPREDRWHRKPTPTLGGVAIFIAFAATLLAGGVLAYWKIGILQPWNGWGWQSWGFLAGSLLMFGIGLYDEFRPMSPAAKLVSQILAAMLVIALGYTSNFFTPKLSDSLLAQIPNILFTFIWLVGITNAVNLLDNMDGLAGGIAFITAVVLSYFFWRSGDVSLLWVSLALAGGVLGFLVFNFPPASIFMGDSGSLFLGFTLAVLAIAHQKQQASDVLAVVGVPALLFMLPILDTALVTITRLLRGQSPAHGGRDHTSHRLIAFGLSERQTLLVLYSVALASAVLAATLETLNYWLSLALAPLVILILALAAGYLGGLKVVQAPPVSRQGQAIARLMLELTYRRRVLEVMLDFVLISVVYYLAFLAYYGLYMDAIALEQYLRTLPMAVAGSYLSFYLFGVYRGMWRYVDVGDLVRYFQAAFGSVAILAALILVTQSPAASTLWAEGSIHYSRTLLALFAFFLFLGLASSRSSFRLLDRLAWQRPQQDGQQVLIIGAGDFGEMALRWMLMNPALKFRPVGFLDPDPFLVGRQIHGVEVLGSIEKLPEVLKRYPAAGIILALPPSQAEQSEALAYQCRQHNRWVRSLRLEFEPVDELQGDS
jgi:UDP-GlcNAc:undecaprenyl-phosphate/decaprenyl-phosphate GlcNAc-1-phosphate transferase